jgi:hypothetical protein
MALEQDQKDFIMNKVKELGTVKKVVDFYNKDCKVDEFAIKYAIKIFKVKGEKR